MDAFEAVVAAILQRNGFWTQISVKVNLTKLEKREIGRHSAPRWELDVVGYRGRDHELRIVECKSFLDSYGVDCSAFDGSNLKASNRYKLFCDPNLRRIVLKRLELQFVEAGFCAPSPKIQLCLAAGKIRGNDNERRLQDYFASNDWLLLGPSFLREQLRDLRDTGYENSVAAIVTKLLLREHI